MISGNDEAGAATAPRGEPKRRSNGIKNRLDPEDRPIHDWYRFVLSFPPHLVREYLHKFGAGAGSIVLDPFCGTGTTLVECKKLGVPSTGLEWIPMPQFAATVKTDWAVDPDALLRDGERIAAAAASEETPNGGRGHRLKTLPVERAKLLLKDSISPLPLHKTLVLLDAIQQVGDPKVRGLEHLALAKALPSRIGNLHFGPEVGLGLWKEDADVVGEWLSAFAVMADDLRSYQRLHAVPACVHRGDARNPAAFLGPESVDFVFTSPPYPNEKDYTRTTRLESVILGFVGSRQDLRGVKRELIRSNTRGVYKADDDDLLVEHHPVIQKLASEIETRRQALGKTSGFERLYPRVTKLYFGGMVRHLKELRPLLRPNARLAYVVGDQASYLRVMIRTGHILADLADSLGYEVESIDLFRTRFATSTGEQLREEAVVLRWPGNSA